MRVLLTLREREREREWQVKKEISVNVWERRHNNDNSVKIKGNNKNNNAAAAMLLKDEPNPPKESAAAIFCQKIGMRDEFKEGNHHHQLLNYLSILFLCKYIITTSITLINSSLPEFTK